MSRALRAALGKLYRAEDGRLAGSQLSSAQRKALDAFARQTGSVQIQPRGRGVFYRIVQPTVVERHWRDLTPIDADELDADLPKRAGNISRARSSKRSLHSHDLHYLLLKAAGPVQWRDGTGHRLDLGLATVRQGAAVLAIDNDMRKDGGWHTTGTLWLVENQALFDRLDWLPDRTHASVAYYGGQLRNGLIEWLAARPRAVRVRFFPDYDGVGLLNYARIKERLGDAVQLWLMPAWESRLRRYGNAELWQGTAREFEAAQRRLTGLVLEPEVLELIRTMQSLGMALEQEAVWVDTT
ncbi:MAG: DUF7281 domain-containing protein [Methylohalobius sp. ZOD2]